MRKSCPKNGRGATFRKKMSQRENKAQEVQQVAEKNQQTLKEESNNGQMHENGIDEAKV